MKKSFLTICALLISVCVCSGCKPYVEQPEPTKPSIPSPEEIAYYEALDLISTGELGDARLKLLECVDYKDAKQILARFVYKCNTEVSNKEYRYSDGTVSINDYRYEYEYDRYGNIILAKGYSDNGTTLSASYEYQYDAYGRLTRQDLYTGDGELYKSYVNEFDSHGNVVKGSIIDHNADYNSFYKEFVYTYDEKGQVLQRIYKNPESGYVYEIESWTYDDHGNKLTYKSTDGNGLTTANNTFVYLFDDQGRITQVTERNALGYAVENYAYEYGADGQILKQTHTENGLTEVTEYNAFNKITQRRCYNNLGAMYIHDVNEYDENGNVTSKIRYRTGDVIDYRYAYTYDQYGLLILEIKYDGDGNIDHSFAYEYADVNLYYNPFL